MMDVADELLVLWFGLAFLHVRKRIQNIPQVNIRKRRTVWVNPYLQKRSRKGRFFNDFEDMVQNPNYFRENFHMSPEQFNHLLSLVKSSLDPQRNTRPDMISAKEKLAMTLEFLASGSLQRHAASYYRVSKQRFGKIIEQTCAAIYERLRGTYMKELTEECFTDVANRYNSRWNFPNCLGSLDGKHVAIKCPPKAASIFYNYKKFHSIVLMAASDADYRFLYIDVGAYGSEGDSSIFRKSDLGRLLCKKKLRIPEDRMIHGELTPYYFIGDDAFPLHRHILKPYSPTPNHPVLTNEEKIFNYRLSRARRCVENSFGILTARWTCLGKTLFVKPEKAQKIVSACCILHNYLMNEEKYIYCPPGFCDSYTEDGTVVPGSWRNVADVEGLDAARNLANNNSRPTEEAKNVRDHVCSFVNSGQGSVPWQYKVIT